MRRKLFPLPALGNQAVAQRGQDGGWFNSDLSQTLAEITVRPQWNECSTSAGKSLISCISASAPGNQANSVYLERVLRASGGREKQTPREGPSLPTRHHSEPVNSAIFVLGISVDRLQRSEWASCKSLCVLGYTFTGTQPVCFLCGGNVL